MFLPATKEEMTRLGWDRLDVILVSGDTYIDSPFIGIAVIGKTLWKAGFRVGIIAQPDINGGDDITRLGEPELFWGVTGGSVDSMIANYTATLKKRRDDDYTPGGLNNRRPDRAVIVYANLIRRYFKNTAPVILGGIEASLRRIAHYDYWSDAIRRSILFDAKADGLVYGMGEKTVADLACRFRDSRETASLRGYCLIEKECPKDALEIPAWEEVKSSTERFIDMFRLFYDNSDPVTGKRLCQRHGDRYVVQNPPPPCETMEEMDRIYHMNYERAVHPWYRRAGAVRALETIRFSIPTHRGCYGECRFCAIALHEGRTVRSRSEASILNEARQLIKHKDFKGNIFDLCGPTANMYAVECKKKLEQGACNDKRCLFPEPCPSLHIDHSRQRALLASLRSLPGIKKVFLASGVRSDMILHDRKEGMNYLRDLVRHHVSGQMKIAPEHSEDAVLSVMGKPGGDGLLRFRKEFYRLTTESGKDQYLTYYFMAAHPGCDEGHMTRLQEFTRRELHLQPEQVQIFIPAPGTWSAVMYYAEKDPFTGEKLFVEKNIARKKRQKEIVVRQKPPRGNQ
ncbi:MAG: YgiQ family radical SAM protein [Deltaproteobacteria bacterium]|nr:YgiQ family radical SAM protein [Deltaproteobacteria bacterium]